MPSDALTRPDSSVAVERTHAFHPEIQALRALAVSLVVIFHIQPSVLKNGFVGVDVFLVISGYLITGHVTRGLLNGRGFHLRDFYVRRIRRLLPAALTVIAAVAVATFAFVPQTQWAEIGKQVVASAFYVENWALAANAVDYSAPGSDTSPLQHFWSLSVEEQFYLVWPAALLAVAVIWRCRRRAALIAAVSVAFAASFAFSIAFTGYDAAAAYFITPTRIWEFAAGGLLALLPTLESLAPRARAALSWAGLALILSAAFALSDPESFPGWIAVLPVVGALAVIAGGDSSARFSPSRLFALRPVQYLGDISYSVYLWHWPLIVIAPIALGSKLTLTIKIGVLVATFVIASLSKRFIEDRFREDRLRIAQHDRGGRNLAAARVVGAALAAMVLVAAATVPMTQIAAAAQTTAERQLRSVLASPPSDFGAAAAGSGVEVQTTGEVVPAPVIAKNDFVEKIGGVTCQESGAFTSLTTCDFGSTDPSALRVALAGDSHASQWLPAIMQLARTNDWHVTTYLRSGCPLSTLGPRGETTGAPTCAPWRAAAMDAIVRGRYDVVFVSAFSETRFDGGAARTGLANAWTRLTGSGARVVAFRDDPAPQVAGIVDVPSCVARHLDDLGQCAVPRSGALLRDPQTEAASAVPGVDLIDLTSYFCTATVCPAVIGGVLVYRDGHHLTATYVRTLIPDIAAQLRQIMPSIHA